MGSHFRTCRFFNIVLPSIQKDIASVPNRLKRVKRVSLRKGAKL